MSAPIHPTATRFSVGGLGIFPSDDGAWVRYQDYAILEAQLAAMTKDRNLWQEAHNEDCPNRAQVEALEAQNRQLREALNSSQAIFDSLVPRRRSDLDMHRRYEAVHEQARAALATTEPGIKDK